jgi:hypothetical protein
MNVGVMKDYELKLTNLLVSHTLGNLFNKAVSKAV